MKSDSYLQYFIVRSQCSKVIALRLYRLILTVIMANSLSSAADGTAEAHSRTLCTLDAYDGAEQVCPTLHILFIFTVHYSICISSVIRMCIFLLLPLC